MSASAPLLHILSGHKSACKTRTVAACADHAVYGAVKLLPRSFWHMDIFKLYNHSLTPNSCICNTVLCFRRVQPHLQIGTWPCRVIFPETERVIASSDRQQ